MAPLMPSNANSIFDKITTGTQAMNLIKQDVEDFLRKNGSPSTRSEFAIKCLNRLATSTATKIENKTLTRGNTLREFVATLVFCHDHIFNRGYDCSVTEDSQIGRSLYAILSKIVDVDYKEAIVVSELIMKTMARNHRIPSADHVGSIVRNSSIHLWNASLKLEQFPAEALRVRLVALTLLSLSDYPKCAAKFCDRALTSALIFNKALDNGRCDDSGHFATTIFNLFSERFIAVLDRDEDATQEAPAALEKLVNLIHLNINRLLKCGRSDEAAEFLSKARTLLDVLDASSNLQDFGNRKGSLLFTFDVLEVASFFAKAVLMKTTEIQIHAENNMFDRLTACITGFSCANFSQFDENCFRVAVSTLRSCIQLLLDKSFKDNSITQVLVPFFHRIVAFYMALAQRAASVSTTVADFITLFDYLTFYQYQHLKFVVHEYQLASFKADLSVTKATLDLYRRYSVAPTAINRSTIIDTFLQRAFTIVYLLYAENMHSEAVVVFHPFAKMFVESFVDMDNAEASETRSTASKKTFWDRMKMIVRCFTETGSFKDALQLLSLFISKGYNYQWDAKAVSLWVSVIIEARTKQEISVKSMTIPLLVSQHSVKTTTLHRARIASLLAKEVELLLARSCPEDEIFPVLYDQLEFSDSPIQKSSTLVQMARLLLSKGLPCDSQGRTASDCCERAIDMLKMIENGDDSLTRRWLALQAKFVAHLSRLRQLLAAIEEKVSLHRARQNDLNRIRNKEAEKMNAAALAAAADASDGDVVHEGDDFISYQPCSVSEELECMIVLDECVDEWMAIFNNDEDNSEMFESVLMLLRDLKLAAEIFSNARAYRGEILVRQLYVKLAKRYAKWVEFVQESSNLVMTLSRLGLVEKAEQVLKDAVSNAARMESNGVHFSTTYASISLQLARSDLCLMQGRVSTGLDHLCSATKLIQAEKKYKPLMILEGRSLLLRSKYAELQASGNSCCSFNALEYASDALKIFMGLLKACSAANVAEQFNVELIGCLLDCGIHLSRLYCDVGLLRDARIFIREQITWTQRFFCVGRTAEVLLLYARTDLAIGEMCDCQTKLNAVRRVIDSNEGSGQQVLNKFKSRPASPPSITLMQFDSPEDNFLSVPQQDSNSLQIAKLEPSSKLISSPNLSPSSSNNSRMVDFASFDGHEIQCSCPWCSNLTLLRIRVDFILLNYELAGLPKRKEANVFRQMKRLSRVEKTLLQKITSSAFTLSSSYVDIATCWTMSRLADVLLDRAMDGARALRIVNAAKTLLNKMRVGLSCLNFLQATLEYQECLSMLLVKASKEGKSSVSELCASVWTRNRIVDSSVYEGVTVGVGRLDLNDKGADKAPALEFKTPKQRHIVKNEGLIDATCKKTTTKSKIKSKTPTMDCQAPAKAGTKSFFQHNFEPDDDSDVQIIDVKIASHSKKFDNLKTSKKDVAPAKDKQQSASKRRVVAVSQKENSDIDDLTTPFVVKKKKVLVFDETSSSSTNRRVLRSNAKITFQDLLDDDDKDDLVVVKAKKSRRILIKPVEVKHAVADEGGSKRSLLEPSTRSNLPRSTKAVKSAFKRIIVADDDDDDDYSHELERFRANDRPDSVVKTVKWRTTDKVRIGCPNYLRQDDDDYFDDGDDYEVGQHFDVGDVVRRLNEALRSIECFPRVPLYGDLNLLLALCKGDKGAATTKTQPRNGVEHILESVSVSFRHKASLRIKSKISISPSVYPKDNERLRALSYKEGSMLAKDGDNGKGMWQRLINRLPKDWVVLQVNALPAAFSGVSSNPELVLTRLENGRNPIMVKMGNPGSNMGVRDFLSEFEAIFKENSDKIRIGARTEWWDVRKALDARLKVFLKSFEDTLLGLWKCLLLGRRAQHEDREQLRDATRDVVKQLNGLSDFDVRPEDEHLLELVLDCWPLLSQRHDLCLSAVAHVCRLTDLADPKIEEAYSVFHAQSVKQWTTDDARRNVVVLVLDKVLSHLPWESLPVLRDHAVTRMPSVHALLGHLALHMDMIGKKSLQSVPKYPKVDTSNSYYVLNPSKDLVRTQTTLEPVFKDYKLCGLAGEAPTSEEWIDQLTTRDLFLYSGHGSGASFCSGEKIDKAECRAAAIMMGCSSGYLRSVGSRLELNGIVYNYLIAGSPCVMGNLWDVTDKDIDRFLITLLQRWMPGSKQEDDSLAHVIPLARLVTTLNYLIGAAPVFYGIPVYSL